MAGYDVGSAITTINVASDTNLSATDAAKGWIVSGPNFSGYNLTMPSGFASSLYTALGGVLLSLYHIHHVHFTAGANYSYTLVNADSDILTADCTTISANNGIISTSWQPRIGFQLTQISPPQFTLFG
jgi:hypothetical protein